MTAFKRISLFVLFVLISPATALPPPGPNWSGRASGQTEPIGGVDVDDFSGRSSHLGRFTGEGFHVLNPVDFTFVGQATWTAANGDTLNVTFMGQLIGPGEFGIDFVAELTAAGGTGRFANAQGTAAMSGWFTGVPGDFFFEFEGSLRLNN